MSKHKYEAIPVEPSGWCKWQSPRHGSGKRNYGLCCCDCNLVHDVQFRVKPDIRGRPSVIFRVRRNNRATAAVRRGKKK